ncbi:MAG: DUF1294 domain-containing protein [Clostridia bacterium]|nr:DUF1294 domain-containing protein [Clostridia bacterium]
MEKFKELLKYAPFIYLGVISLIAIIITCYDKIAAKHFPGHRTPEATLLAISAIGGSVAMYLTMQIIRHKTQHKKFMIGIPVIFFIQLLLGFGVWYLWLR